MRANQEPKTAPQAISDLCTVTLRGICAYQLNNPGVTGPPIADFLGRRQWIGPGIIPEHFSMWTLRDGSSLPL